MILKMLLIIILACKRIYSFFMLALSQKQRQLPLPKLVNDIYTPERYQEFISYKKGCTRPTVILGLISFIVECFYLFSPFYRLIERLGQGNIYLILLWSLIVESLIEFLITLSIDHYSTFVIEERYHKNKKTKGLFFKDEITEFITNLFLMIILLMPLTAVISYLYQHSLLEHLTLFSSFLVVLFVLLLGLLLFTVIMYLSYLYLHTRYHFTELEDGELRDEITRLMSHHARQVKHILVYDESRRSTGKNAFLLKLPGYREIGIADNFLDENSHDELLAVLCHEIGHLKHKKNIYNYLTYLFVVLVVILLIFLLLHLAAFKPFALYVRDAFHIRQLNVLLFIHVFATLLTPLNALLSFYHRFVSRKEEYEADDNAVRNGYGKALIEAFKSLSADQLIDVNPAPLVEELEYDHPGMYNRIRHIDEKMKEVG